MSEKSFNHEVVMTETITGLFNSSATAYPDNIAFHYLRDEWQAMTYGELSSKVAALAAYLLKKGVKSQDRIAIISENRPEWCIAYLSVLSAGCIAVPLDSQLGPSEVRNLLWNSEAGIVFHSSKTFGQPGEFAKYFNKENHKDPVVINFDGPDYKEAELTAPVPELPACNTDDTASIIYTSGTTGTPKGVVLSHRNFCSDAKALIDAGIVSHQDNVLAILPLHHTYAFMCTFLVPVFLGGSITYPGSMKGPDMIAAISGKGVSVVIGVPQLLSMIRNGIMSKINAAPRLISIILGALVSFSGSLRRQTGINLGRVIFGSVHRRFGKKFRFFTSGGARLDPAVMDGLEALGFTVLEGYGLTETSPVVTFNPVQKRKAGSAGRPLPSVMIRISNPSDTGEGEIEIKGPMVMQGYYRNPDATADVLHDGWFRTGDIGRFDSDGFLFITGRSKEVIVLSSGKNVYPEDAEKIYLGSKLIKEICILGLGQGAAESLHAVIVPDFEYARHAAVSNLHEAIKWEINDISGSAPSYMRINGFTLRKEPLPRTPLGKLRRFMIRPDQQPEVKEASETAAPSDGLSMAVFSAVGNALKEPKVIRPEDNLELDLGLDSLSKIELVVALEQAFSLKLPEDFMADVHTVNELVDKIRRSAEGVQASDAVRTGWKEIIEIEPQDRIILEEPGSLMLPSRIGHGLLRSVLKLFFRLETKGIENIPIERNFILAPNHTSYMDGFVVVLSLPFSFFRNLYSLGTSDYFAGGFGGWFAKTAHVIPIDSSFYLSRALQTSSYVLRHNRSLSVFPEGGRSPDGSLLEFKKGVGILAKEMGVPVVPVYIKGAFEALPRTAYLPRFVKITVTFGKPLSAEMVDFSNKSADMDDYQYFASLIRQKVKELSEKA